MSSTSPEAARNEAHAQLVRALELLWNGHTPAGRGPKPGLTVETIVDVAITVADADGVDALSMRRIARELGVGTMTLYRYVPDKNVLLALVLDRILAPSGPSPQGPRTWRATLESDAWSGRELYLRHPWLLQVNMSRPTLGPGSVAGLEQTMAGLRDLPMSDKEKINVVTAVDGFVTGAVRQQVYYEQIAEESGLDDQAFWGAQLPFMEAAMQSGEYPVMATLGADAFDGTWEATFEVGLNCLLDGLELRAEQRR
ncbi:TetR/AcrR family transcriptional regulator [Ruania halotolerans]|uniref:TetR/AcrR family transcriptional regulator n=1 Tax=Ruania halotolerans TaxID=2897773 RepID=UPI001E2C1817|nr:TetR/AcrR family transcriptional regulator [Ruania halotolerans]UFU07150.1 TetR/AcrR family transcriptional regulator [Ruania halotolerans]